MRLSLTKIAGIALAVVSVVGAVVPASAANVLMVREKVTFKAGADEVWGKIGDFCAIADWHPAVKGCVEEADTRTLSLADGGVIVETRTGSGDKSYKYIISESPLPVEHYKASFKIKDRKDGTSMLIWSATFSPVGVTEAEAKAVIQGIFDAGIESLKGEFI